MSDWAYAGPAKRFPHKSQGKHKGKGRHGRKGNDVEFQPRNMLGRYTVKCSQLRKLCPDDSQAEMCFEIHELVADDTAYLASFDFGILNGVMLIAGSRRSLRDALERESVQDDPEIPDRSETSPDSSSETDVGEADIERPPEHVGHAFEKNTFRNPKWFAMWRGRVLDSVASSVHEAQEDQPSLVQADTVPTHNAHLEFSTAACSDFQGTLTCPQLGLDEISWSGMKLTAKSTPAQVSWLEYVS